jgi:14-3-3 protein epsilon
MSFPVLPATSPLLLGVSLNLAVLYHEIDNDVKKAVEIAETAFNEAAEVLNDLNDQEYKDSTTVMQLLYDNLKLWREELDSAQK